MKYSIVILLLAGFLITELTGCATGWWGRRNVSGISRYVNGDAVSVWEAIDQALIGVRVKERDVEKGFVVTDWVKGYSTTRDMGLLLEGRWQERYRLFITVEPEQGRTYLSVEAYVEEKAPGGSRAYRWERVPSNGMPEQMFLEKVEQILNAQE
ncbi:MAG: hypothetical protein E3K37_10890 [Candidatus Kuenenia sp.]|nr:hypothetical protein [Candidatus Kuenenia hertensis]